MKFNKKKIYLHIGLHKTGTTYLQNVLFKNFDTLKKNNILYPKSGIKHFGHHKIAWYFKKNTFKDCYNDLVNEIENFDGEKIFISSEEFDFLNLNEITLLNKQLGKYGKIIIVFYFRRQDELLKSIWIQRIKHGVYTKSINSFCTNIIKNKSTYYNNIFNKLNFNIFLKKWEDVFGKENIKIFNFNNREIQNFEKPLFNFLKISGDLNKEKIEKNAAYPYSFLEIIRKTAKRIDISEREILTKKLSGSIAYFLIEFSDYTKKLEEEEIMMNNLKAKILKKFEPSNKNFCKKYSLLYEEIFLLNTEKKPTKSSNFKNNELLNNLNKIFKSMASSKLKERKS